MSTSIVSSYNEAADGRTGAAARLLGEAGRMRRRLGLLVLLVFFAGGSDARADERFDERMQQAVMALHTRQNDLDSRLNHMEFSMQHELLRYRWLTPLPNALWDGVSRYGPIGKWEGADGKRIELLDVCVMRVSVDPGNTTRALSRTMMSVEPAVVVWLRASVESTAKTWVGGAPSIDAAVFNSNGEKLKAFAEKGVEVNAAALGAGPWMAVPPGLGVLAPFVFASDGVGAEDVHVAVSLVSSDEKGVTEVLRLRVDKGRLFRQ